MAVFDIFIASLIFISAAIGLGRGFVKESLSLASWIGGYIWGSVFWACSSNNIPRLMGRQPRRSSISFHCDAGFFIYCPAQHTVDADQAC